MVSEEYPVGVTDFAELVTGGYRFVDKTQMISHLCRNPGKRFMFARPRGFGKTLNLTMVDRFFNMRYADEPDVFEGLLVEDDAEAMELKNSLPVIRLDLGGLGDDIERDLSAAVADALRPFAGSEGLNDFDERFVEDCLGHGLDRVELWDSVRRMCEILEHLHGELPIVLVDDYDACFRGIRTKDRYREVSSIVGTFMEQTFKHNTCMRFGAIFAEMPSLRTGMFRGFDSYCLCGIENREGEGFFGFSRGEVEGLLEEAESPSEDVDPLEERFGGLRIGDADVLEPAGVIAHLSGVRGPSTPRGLPEGFISSLGAVPLYALRGLIENPGTTEVAVLDHMVSHVEAATPAAGMSQVCSYLSMTGSLRAERTGRQIGGWPVYRFGIPNDAVRDALSPLVRRAG